MKQFPGVLLLTLSLALFSCSRQEADVLRLTAPLPGGVVSQDAAITLAFSRGVVRTDSVNLWTDTPFIEFTPHVPGKFVWQDSARLVFSPDGPMSGDTKFRGKINTALLRALAGAKSFDGPEEFTFATESFTLKQAEFFYDRIGESRQVGVKANLEFTYAVNPQDVQEHIRVSVDKEAQPGVRVVSTDKGKLIAIEVGVVSRLDKEREIAVDFDNDLVSPETGTRLKLEKSFLARLSPLGELQIYGHEFGFDGTNSWIRVRTSQEVDAAAVKSHVTLDPARQFTVQPERDGFVLRGIFEPGSAFRMTITKGLESVLGGKTQNDYEAELVIGNVAPSFRFTSESGLYMLSGGQKAVEIRTINMSKVAVRVSQVFQNNLVFFLEGGRFYDYSYVDDGDEEGLSSRPRRKYRYYLGNYGRQLSYDTLEVQSPSNQEVTTLFDLHPYLNTGYKGFYLLEIANPAEAWRTTSKLISISDIGLIVKQSADEVLVFATSLDSNGPLADVLVSLISTNNQTIGSAKTDRDGVARFTGYRALAKDFKAKLVTAEAENDFNFINLEDYRVENSRFDVAGKRDAADVYDALLYGDRNIYRPGETVHISGIVRTLHRPLPEKMPVRLKVFDPRGAAVREMQFTLNEEGSFETSYQTREAALTGEYRIELFTGNGRFLATYKVSIEDFVPDRLKLTLNASHESARPGEKITYDLTALNFFGPPAAGRSWEFEGAFDVLPYKSKTYPAFRFSDDAAKNYSAKPEIYTGVTDGNGKARIEFPLPQDLTSTGLLRARGRVAVFDESGRPVYQLAQTTIYPKPYSIGVLYQGAYYVSPATPQKIQIVALDQQDRLISGFKAKVDLVRYEWHSVLRQHEATKTLRYVSERREIPVKSDPVTIADKPAEYTYVVPRSGDYAVRVSKEGDQGYNQFSFYSYSWGTTDITSFEVDPEARVEIVLDKSVYAPGEKAKILFQGPFNGKMLVTVERNQVLSYRYLDVVDNAASMELAVDETFLPNVYISAVLFRKIREMNIPLMAGHGFAPLMVEKKSNKLDVVIGAPEKIRPRTKQKVTVNAEGERNVFVTLAAVDEGICQVKNYKTPDPYGYFYAKRALETETFDFFKHLLPEPQVRKGRSSTGGGEAELAKRVNPLGVKRFKPLAIWSGIVKTDGAGVVEVTLDVPEFNGELRLMALAYKGDRFGSAQRGMKVADPVIITPALPRFLSPNDSTIMPVTAFNTTEKPVTLKFNIETSGGIEALARSATLEVGPNQERYIGIPLRTTRQIGKATVRVVTAALGEQLETTTEIPIRPVSPFMAESFSGSVDGGNSVSQLVGDTYLPYGRRSYITLSPYPVANFAKELKNLLGYPHGCLEQTVSKAFPQLYLRDVAGILAPSALSGGSPMYFVNEAISKVASMQMADGAFLYWPGGGATNNWTTVYATHFLLEAKKAGYAVPEATLKSALDALGQMARGKKTEDYSSYDANRIVVRRIADKAVIYALYVLAIGGVPEQAAMNFYRNEKSLLTTDTRYLLAGAFALSGDRRTYTELLPPQFAAEEAQRTSGWNFDSPIRANAIILNVLLETDLNNINIPRYMEYLSKVYRSSAWYSTQDDAFTLLAFGKAARLASATKVEGTVGVGGKEFAYKGGNQKLDIEPYGQKVTLSMTGTGRVYYSIVTEGIRSDGVVRIEDKNLQVRRELLDRSGVVVNPASVRQNDLIVVKIVLNSSVDRLDYVAVTDLLPAGFEIENPRITETTNYAFIKNPSVPEYMDIRDDRINLYTSFRGKRQQTYYYAVRAVTAGTFQYAPIVAEAMYDANYYSASGRGVVHVRPVRSTSGSSE